MGGPGPIPLSEILAYCDIYRIEDLDERDELVTFVRAMDQAYLEHVTKDTGKGKAKT